MSHLIKKKNKNGTILIFIHIKSYNKELEKVMSIFK
jgi:hypothetical protein